MSPGAIVFYVLAGVMVASAVMTITRRNPVHSAVFLVLASSIFMNEFFLVSRLDMAPYFQTLPLLLVLFGPAITMRSWAEEYAHGTAELILTLPLRPFWVVLGKYLAALCFYLVVLAGSSPIVVMLAWLGSPDLGRIAASYVGGACLGAFFLSLGLFVSSLTREQIVAFVLSSFFCALLVLSGHASVVRVLDGLRPEWQLGTWLSSSVSVLPRYEPFVEGLIRVSDLIYFALATLFFLVMNELTLRGRRK